MSNKVKTYLIVGSLGVGKTSLLQQLLKQKLLAQRWAILLNEFGKVGVDKALLGVQQQATISEIAGGCLCCTNGAPFQVGLSKLLKVAKPDVLFIELSGLGHPLPIQRQLLAEPWQSVLDLQPMIQVLTARQALENRVLVNGTGLLLVNKSEQISSLAKEKIIQQYLGTDIYWTVQGYLPLSRLPQRKSTDKPVMQQIFLAAKWGEQQEQILLEEGIVCNIQKHADGWAIGWHLTANYYFEQQKLISWLTEYPWVRAKIVVRTERGWFSINAIKEEEIVWKLTEWRKDNRIELIFATELSTRLIVDKLLTCISR